MKALNPIKFVANLTIEIEKYKTNIRNAENIEKARRNAIAMQGYINCTITFLNTMIDSENNDFTASLDELVNEWLVDMYGTLAEKAIELKMDSEYIHRLLQKRDEIAY